jgi:hypothetical protein
MTDIDNSLQERNQQLLSDIAQLQSQEQQLYNNLDDVTLTADQKQQIINQINEISQMRLNMYGSMKDMYSFYQKDVSASRTTLGQEMTALDIMENELNQSKINLNSINDQKRNKLRLVEINTYYGKQYNAHSRLMKTVVAMCIPLIILAILANSGILPSKFYMLLAGAIIIIAVILIGYQVIDMSNRSNMNWDEYNWKFNESSAPTSDTTATTDSQNPWAIPTLTCIGSACCADNSTFDGNINKCIPTALYNQQYPESAVPSTTTTSTTTTTTAPTTTAPTTTATTETFKGLGRFGYLQLKATPIQSIIKPVQASLYKF